MARERCECTATRDGALRVTTSASADERDDRGVRSVMEGSCKLSSIWDVAGDCETGRVARTDGTDQPQQDHGRRTCDWDALTGTCSNPGIAPHVPKRFQRAPDR
ncbi:hypothetical protein BJS_01791 [Bradyrhizobium japonicum SEMIA 5079]|nr:hypothetical protein BJS_01791 [Bradyrhizobium japonicum SEMIA 5079]